MALTKDIVEIVEYVSDVNSQDVITRNIEHSNAYIAIHKIDGTKNTLSVHVDAFEDSTKVKRIWRKIFYFSPSVADGSENFMRQAYKYLKTLPDFSDAEDC